MKIIQKIGQMRRSVPNSMRKLFRTFSTSNVKTNTTTKGVDHRVTNKNRNSMQKMLRAFSLNNIGPRKETIRQRLRRQSRDKVTKNGNKNKVTRNNVTKNVTNGNAPVTRRRRPKPSVIKADSRLAREKLERQKARERERENDTRKSKPIFTANSPTWHYNNKSK